MRMHFCKFFNWWIDLCRSKCPACRADKIVCLFFLLLAVPAYGSGLTPPGTQGDIITNGGNNEFGADILGSGLVQTTTNGQTFLSSTATGGVAPAGALGAIQYNLNASFGGLNLAGNSLLGAYFAGSPTTVYLGSGLALTTSGGITTLNTTGSPSGCPSTGIAEENGACIVTENGQYIIEE